MHLGCYPPKICILLFLLDITVVPREIEETGCAFFFWRGGGGVWGGGGGGVGGGGWGENKEHYGLCEYGLLNAGYILVKKKGAALGSIF